GRTSLTRSSADYNRGMKWTAVGLCLGIVGALLIALWLSRNFYGLNFFDPASFAVMTALVAGTAAPASYIPARQASRPDPMKMLRQDSPSVLYLPRLLFPPLPNSP